ncbi:uncharacterized protein LOC122666205 isoform X1 [Telopea speciosissima]|uniref:uncharacterized protein LOC122666205 isoform X1 n=1 Tax=Telopea speciosissima TaxID=54955 RepID=UPI001CC77996|nr:uncharacterized protein LOC122666205 isoform X1 [Telopea speciosissima]
MDPPHSLLLGPPEIHLSTPSSAGKPKPASSGNPFMDALVSGFNNIASKPPMGFTENNSPTFLSTGNPCLDFFFHVVPDTPPENLKQWLDLAWSHNALTTLKLICNLRGVRGTGKSDKEGFYTAALWLHKNHPKTLACNVRWFADFGYFKDLPEILYRLIEGADVRKNAQVWRPNGVRTRRPRPIFKRKKSKKRRPQRVTLESFMPRVKWNQRIAAATEKVINLKKEKVISKAKKAVERYSRDPDYRYLHDRVSDVFAELLVADLQFLKSRQLSNISLAAKWCPSLDSSFDRSILLCESIARRVFPRNSYLEYEGVEEAHYAYRIRDRLRKEYLVPLRKVLELSVVYMSANLWNSLPYNRVASVAMKTYKGHFLKHDQERFQEYLGSVQRGEAKIAAGALLPHEIIASLNDVDGGKVAELQWQRMVDDLSKEGKLRNCIAVCDVSGSMDGTPMEVCVALGLLISELSEEPWKGKVITFSHRPQLHMIEGNDLESKTEFIRKMNWGANTDFQRLFDQILKVAVEGKLKEEQMIKRVFVFSDMEFDQASENNWETDYKAIQWKFKESGYGSVVPEIVFWNLRDSRATPVPSNQSGVALVSGFSKNMVTLFLENDGLLSPDITMELAISGADYQKLVVLD